MSFKSKIYKKILVTILVLGSFNKFYSKEIISLSNTESLIRDSENILLEHALMDYIYFMPNKCEQTVFYLTLDPYFRKLSHDNKEIKIKSHEAAGFLQAQLNWCDFWIRSNIIFGKLKESFSPLENKKSITGIDDLMIKIGYTWYNDGCQYFGADFIVQIPTNREIKSTLGIINSIEAKQNKYGLIFETPQIGSRNLTLGGGFYGGYTIFKWTESSLSVLADLQFRHALKTSLPTQMEMPDINHAFTLTANRIVDEQSPEKNIKEKVNNFKEKENFIENGTQNLNPKTLEQEYVVQQTIQLLATEKCTVKFSPGQSVDFWIALHYNFCNFDLEIGSTFSTNFNDHLTTTALPTFTSESLKKLLQEKNVIIKIKSLQKIETHSKIKTESQAKSTSEIDNFEKTNNNEDNSTNFAVDVKSIESVIAKNYHLVKFSAKPYIAINYNTSAYNNPLVIGLGLSYQHDSIEGKPNENNLKGFLVWGSITLSF